jgi:hypothetical protein
MPPRRALVNSAERKMKIIKNYKLYLKKYRSMLLALVERKVFSLTLFVDIIKKETSVSSKFQENVFY